MSIGRQLLNQKIKDPTCDFRTVFLCLKQLNNLDRPDWGNKIPSPLIVAVEKLRQDLVVLMVRQFRVDVNSVDKIYSEGNDIRPRTALHRAVDMNNSSMVMQLLRLGADPINMEAWSMLPSVGLVYGSALENAIFARYYAVSKSIEYFIRKEQEKTQGNNQSIKIIIGTPKQRNRTPSIPEISEEKRRQSMLNNFNDKVYDFFELNTEFQSIESRISGEKRPKMDEIKTMEAYMNQQKDRKNFIDYEDLKLLEQHLSDYLILQTDNQQEKSEQDEDQNEKMEVERIREQLMLDLKTILQCSQCCQLEQNLEMSIEPDKGLKENAERKMYSCSQEHLICHTCLQNVRMNKSDDVCPMCITNQSSNLRRNFLAEKLIEAFSEVQLSDAVLNNNNNNTTTIT